MHQELAMGAMKSSRASFCVAERATWRAVRKNSAIAESIGLDFRPLSLLKKNNVTKFTTTNELLEAYSKSVFPLYINNKKHYYYLVNMKKCTNDWVVLVDPSKFQ